jgi:hypothetical protein
VVGRVAKIEIMFLKHWRVRVEWFGEGSLGQ